MATRKKDRSSKPERIGRMLKKREQEISHLSEQLRLMLICPSRFDPELFAETVEGRLLSFAQALKEEYPPEQIMVDLDYLRCEHYSLSEELAHYEFFNDDERPHHPENDGDILEKHVEILKGKIEEVKRHLAFCHRILNLQMAYELVGNTLNSRILAEDFGGGTHEIFSSYSFICPANCHYQHFIE